MPSFKSDTMKMIESRETCDIDFKESPSNLETEDLVAFANACGGTILIGVRELQDASGMQRGEVIGWIGDYDKDRLKVMNKAANCLRPIKLTVNREYDGDKYIMRVDIEEILNKPCCTQKGLYKTREDGKNRGIAPTEMTALILETKASDFARKLQDAGAKFAEDLMRGQEELTKLISRVELIAAAAEAAANQAAASAEEAAQASTEAVDAAYDRE